MRPDWAKAHYNRGVTLRVMGDPRQAREAMEKALQIDPDYADALNNLGSLLAAEGKHAAAGRTFRRLLKVDPGNATGWNELGSVLSALDQKKEAVDAYRKAAEGALKGVLEYSEAETVSVDYNGNPHSAIVDATDAARLEIIPGRPVLCLDGVDVDSADCPVLTTHSRFVADRIALIVET